MKKKLFLRNLSFRLQTSLFVVRLNVSSQLVMKKVCMIYCTTISSRFWHVLGSNIFKTTGSFHFFQGTTETASLQLCGKTSRKERSTTSINALKTRYYEDSNSCVSESNEHVVKIKTTFHQTQMLFIREGLS